MCDVHGVEGALFEVYTTSFNLIQLLIRLSFFFIPTELFTRNISMQVESDYYPLIRVRVNAKRLTYLKDVSDESQLMIKRFGC